MKVTVLGKSPSWQDSGGACSGYLIEHEEFTLLLDCGSGAFGKLRSRLDYVQVDAVLLSHMHADHFLDIIPFASGLSFGRNAGSPAPRRPPLHAPPGARETFRTVAGCWHREDLVETAFHLREYDPEERLTVGPFTVKFCPVPHYVPTFAVDLRQSDGRRFTFGADCGPNEGLESFARGTDLLVLEATLREPEPDNGEARGHLTPAEAGALAQRAEVQRALITHYSDELDPGWIEQQARTAFDGRLELAREGLELTVGN